MFGRPSSGRARPVCGWSTRTSTIRAGRRRSSRRAARSGRSCNWRKPASARRSASGTGRSPIDDRPLQLGEGAAGLAMERRQAVVVTNYQSWENGLASFKKRQLQAAEAVPLLVADRAIGALVVRFYSLHEVSPREEEILA